MWEEAHELMCSMFVIEVCIWEEAHEHKNIFIIEACTRGKSVQLTLCTYKGCSNPSEFDHYPPAIEDVRHRNHTTLDIQRLYS